MFNIQILGNSFKYFDIMQSAFFSLQLMVITYEVPYSYFHQFSL